MIQDLWIPADNVVPGDRVVFGGEFRQVLDSYADGDMWCLKFDEPWQGQHYLFSNGEYQRVRVRPCGP